MRKRITIPAAMVFAMLAVLSLTEAASAYYSPAKGRFLARDPIGEKGGLNSGSFVLNRPVNSVDTVGLAAWVHKNGWDDEWKKRYRQFVRDHARDYVNRPEDCATLTLMLLVDFAAENGLPVTFWSESGCIWVSKSCQWSSKEEFWKRITRSKSRSNAIHSNELYNKNTGPDLKPEEIQAGDIGTRLGHALLVTNAMKPGELSDGQEKDASGQVRAKQGVLEWNKDYAYQHPEAHFFIYNPTSTDGHRVDYLNHTGEGKRTQVAELKYNRLISEITSDGIHFRFWMSGVFSNYKTWDGTTVLKDECKK